MSTMRNMHADVLSRPWSIPSVAGRGVAMHLQACVIDKRRGGSGGRHHAYHIFRLGTRQRGANQAARRARGRPPAGWAFSNNSRTVWKPALPGLNSRDSTVQQRRGGYRR